ncbi:MAG TPA: DUF5655 domain-containing protein [Acidimicrobiales bacterium]|nr:DUF5655 domain-containing protein [Acidimicrobiales bacterium]
MPRRQLEMWTCPECRRRFGRAKQSHACQPGLSVQEYFSTGPPWERPIFEAVEAHLTSLGPIHVEPVQVGIFFKTTRTIIELRPKTSWVALSFSLPRRVQSPRISRKVVEWSGRFHHVVNLRSPDEVDEEVKGWLSECYATG